MLVKTDITHNANDVLELVKHFQPGKNVLNVPTGRFFYDPWVTMPAYKDTAIDVLLKKIPNVGEARINILAPGESYMAHADIDDRHHLNLDGEYSFLIDLDNNIMYKLECDNTVYCMDTSRIHTASNYGYKNRIQLVVRKLLVDSTLIDPIHLKITAVEAPYNLRYLFDNTFSITLNKLNKKGVLASFEKVSDVSISFAVEKEFLSEIDKCVVSCGFKVKVEYL